LLHEVAAMCADVGRLIEFTNSMDLLPIISSVLRGGWYPAVPLGGKLIAGEPAYNWSTCGEHILDFAGCLKASENPERWRGEIVGCAIYSDLADLRSLRCAFWFFSSAMEKDTAMRLMSSLGCMGAARRI